MGNTFKGRCEGRRGGESRHTRRHRAHAFPVELVVEGLGCVVELGGGAPIGPRLQNHLLATWDGQRHQHRLENALNPVQINALIVAHHID